MLHVGTVIYMINTLTYEDVIFEIELYFDLLGKHIHVDSEIMYILSMVHIVVLINLKKFEFFWDIMDKKIFRK